MSRKLFVDGNKDDFSHQNHMGVTRALGEAFASGEWLLAGLVDSFAWLKRAPEQPTYSIGREPDVGP